MRPVSKEASQVRNFRSGVKVSQYKDIYLLNEFAIIYIYISYLFYIYIYFIYRILGFANFIQRILKQI